MNTFISSVLLLLFVSLGHSTSQNSINNKAIDTLDIVRIASTNQVIRIKGDDHQNPVLLYLNGGPGDSVLGQIDRMFGELQKEFTVVLWDQRNVGKTLQQNNASVPLTQELFKNDTYLMVQYLLKKFNKKKIVLVGHSYGTTLGFDMAHKHPELLHAFVATNPLIHQIESELITLNMLKEHAQKNKNDKALTELSMVTVPFKTGEELYYARKWLFDFEGKRFAKKKSFKKRVLSWSSTWLELFNEASQENQLYNATKNMNCPVIFIVGQKDYQTSSILTKDYYKGLQAPQKAIHSIENAGHLIPYNYGKEFQEVITKNIKLILQKDRN